MIIFFVKLPFLVCMLRMYAPGGNPAVLIVLLNPTFSNTIANEKSLSKYVDDAYFLNITFIYIIFWHYGEEI